MNKHGKTTMKKGEERFPKGQAYYRGRQLLISFSNAYYALGQVCERYDGLTRRVAAGLIEIYLDELGDSYNESNRVLPNRSFFIPYVVDIKQNPMQLNEYGYTVVRSLIFAIRNRQEEIRERKLDKDYPNRNTKIF